MVPYDSKVVSYDSKLVQDDKQPDQLESDFEPIVTGRMEPILHFQYREEMIFLLHMAAEGVYMSPRYLLLMVDLVVEAIRSLHRLEEKRLDMVS